MKLILDLNDKFLKKLLILILMYFTGIAAKTEKYCQWNYCEPIHVEKKWSWWRGWQKTTKYFGRQRDKEPTREYTNNDLIKIRDECNEWRGQWPLNCPMTLVGNVDNTWTHQNLMWTNELLEDINNYRREYKKPSLKCRVPVGYYNIGFFGEANYNMGQALGTTYTDCMDVGFLMTPFLGTGTKLAEAIIYYNDLGIIDWKTIVNYMVANHHTNINESDDKKDLFEYISRDPKILMKSSLLFSPFLQSTVIYNFIVFNSALNEQNSQLEIWIGPTDRKQKTKFINMYGKWAGQVPYSDVGWSIGGMHRPGTENWYSNPSNYIHWL